MILNKHTFFQLPRQHWTLLQELHERLESLGILIEFRKEMHKAIFNEFERVK